MIESASSLRKVYKQIPPYYWVAISSWITRVITSLTSLLSVRLILNTLGVDTFAAYTILTSILGWLMLADLGISQSLQNYISKARASNKNYEHVIIWSTKYVLFFLALILLLSIAFSSPASSALLIQFTSIDHPEKRWSFILIIVLGLMTTAGNTIFRVWYAEQIGYRSNIVTALASILSLGIIFLVSVINTPNKLILAILASCAPLALLSFSLLILRLKERQYFTAAADYQKQILKNARGFSIFNLVATATISVDLLVLSQYANPDQIATYSIASKLYSLVGFVFVSALQAFWPVSAEAIHTGNWLKTRSFTKKYLLFSIPMVCIFSAVFLIYNKQISVIFGLTQYNFISRDIVLLFCILYVVRAWTDVFAVLLQSFNDMNSLIVFSATQASFSFFLQLILVPKYGIHGTLAALTVAWMSTTAWALPLRVLKVQRNHLKLI